MASSSDGLRSPTRVELEKMFLARMRALLLVLMLVMQPGILLSEDQEDSQKGPDFFVPAGDKIHVGVGSLLSGVDAYLGREVLAGAQAFLKDHPTVSGHTLGLIPVDDGCDRLITMEQARAFCSMDPKPIAVVGYLCTPGCLAALEIHATCNLPLLNVTSASPRLTAAGSPWLLRLWTSREQQGSLVAQWVRKKRIRHVLLIHDMDPTTEAIADAFKGAISKYAQDSKALSISLIEAKQQMDSLFAGKNAAQLIYYVGKTDKLVDLWSELPEEALQKSWIQESRMETWLSESDSASQPKELYCIELQLPTGDPLSPQYQYFRGRFGEPGVYTLAAHDALAVLVHALEQTAKSDQDGTTWDMAELMKALKNTEIHGLSGAVSFDEQGNRTQVPGKILKWVKGHWEPHWSGIVPKPTK